MPSATICSTASCERETSDSECSTFLSSRKSFDTRSRTAASIAICRYPIDQATGLPLRSNAKYPGYVDAQNYIISNFKFVDGLNNDKMKRMFANSVLQASLKTYAPELIERVRTSREERTKKKYEEKGYPA